MADDVSSMTGARAALDDAALAQLFGEARTYSGWLPKKIPEADLYRLYELLRMAPTAMNGSPGRFVFVVSDAGKERLLPFVAPMNQEKVRAAAATVIVARDLRFFENADTYFPARAEQIKAMDPAAPMVRDTATRNATLQGAYLILAARALGLDCGPMSGFAAPGVNGEFFPDGRFEADFLVNLGYGDPASLFPRNPRLSFEQACQIV